MSELNHIINVCRAAAAGNVGVLSTGEQLVAAVVLNRSDWLAERGYTMVGALTRIGPDWVGRLAAAAKAIADDDLVTKCVADGLALAKARPVLPKVETEPTTLHYAAKLVTYGHAPGYRDASLELDLREIDGTLSGHKFRADIRLNAEDSADVAQHIMRVHAFAWSTPRGPIDLAENEKRPRWLPA